MRLRSASVALALACAALAACHGGTKTPSGQVAATVGGQEITVRQLNAEVPPVATADPKARKAVQGAVLRDMVYRKLIADEAHSEGLDKTPDFELAKQRLMEILLVQSLQAKVAGEVPAPTREEAEAFIAAHPNSFAERKIYSVDEVEVAQAQTVDLHALLAPLNTVEAVAAALAAKNVPYRRQTRSLDSLAFDPKVADSVATLPANEVFALPSGNLLLINQIQQTQVVPFTGEAAIAYAIKYLKQQHIQQAVQKEMSSIVSHGVASVRYNPGYTPPPLPAPPAAKP